MKDSRWRTKYSILHNINYSTNVLCDKNDEYCVFNIIIDIIKRLILIFCTIVQLFLNTRFSRNIVTTNFIL